MSRHQIRIINCAKFLFQTLGIDWRKAKIIARKIVKNNEDMQLNMQRRLYT